MCMRREEIVHTCPVFQACNATAANLMSFASSLARFAAYPYRSPLRNTTT